MKAGCTRWVNEGRMGSADLSESKNDLSANIVTQRISVVRYSRQYWPVCAINETAGGVYAADFASSIASVDEIEGAGGSACILLLFTSFTGQ